MFFYRRIPIISGTFWALLFPYDSFIFQKLSFYLSATIMQKNSRVNQFQLFTQWLGILLYPCATFPTKWRRRKKNLYFCYLFHSSKEKSRWVIKNKRFNFVFVVSGSGIDTFTTSNHLLRHWSDTDEWLDWLFQNHCPRCHIPIWISFI